MGTFISTLSNIAVGSNLVIQSWTPLSIASKVLFWGKVSEISGGQMPNKVTGATDFLTVVGSPYTFQCPNTAPYIAADTDYIWFKSDTTQRTTTTAELIGYDLPRTPVMYLDATPNTLEEIMILKAGAVLTTAEENNMRDYMRLSRWWSNVLILHGVIKDNRGIGQSVWNAESVYDEDALALFTRMTAAGETPDAARKAIINDAFAVGKTKAFWAKLDDVWLLAAHGEASHLMNLFSTGSDLLQSGTKPTFTIDRGGKGNGNSMYYDTQTASDGTKNYKLNDCIFGVYTRSDINALECAIGSQKTATGAGIELYPRYSATCYMKANSVGQPYRAVTDSLGLFAVNKTSSSAATIVKGTTMGAITGSLSTAGLSELSDYLLAKHRTADIQHYSNNEIALAFKGGSFTQTDIDDFFAVFVTGYLTSVGANV